MGQRRWRSWLLLEYFVGEKGNVVVWAIFFRYWTLVFRNHLKRTVSFGKKAFSYVFSVTTEKLPWRHPSRSDRSSPRWFPPASLYSSEALECGFREWISINFTFGRTQPIIINIARAIVQTHQEEMHPKNADVSLSKNFVLHPIPPFSTGGSVGFGDG